jgi:predicted TIM-barrel fold metal-dependent hydrolase
LQNIDVDQHLFEPRNIWAEHIDPADREDALAIVDDENGWPWLTWQGNRLFHTEMQRPGEADEIGEARRAMFRGDRCPIPYDEQIPATYTDAAARLGMLDDCSIDHAVLFPNYGLVWEGMLGSAPAARRANLRAYNRWMTANLSHGGGRLHGVAQVVLDDLDWLRAELQTLKAAGIRFAMVAPAPVDGRPLSDPELDPAWQAFCDAGITPTFHVAGFKSPIDPAWLKNDPGEYDQFMDSVFLNVAPAVAVTDLIVHGVFERFADLHVAIVELTAGWVPAFLLQIDGAYDFFAARHGEPPRPLLRRPSEYFRDHIRVAALPYENPARLARHVGSEVFMIGSDWPHAEGVRDPGTSALRVVASLPEEDQHRLLSGNAAALLGIAS